MEEEENAMAVNNEPTRSKKHAKIHRSFLHFSNALKKLHGGGHANTNDKSSSSSPASSFLSGCMHPRTNSFAFSSRRRRHATSDNGREHDDDEDNDGALAVEFGSLRLGTTAAAVADAGGSSSSTQDFYTDGGSEEREGVPPPAKAVACCGAGGVAVVTLSAAPYEDFRRSMREMVDAARGEAEVAASEDDDDDATRAPAVDWDLMEELLFCYLELNDRAVHKDILRAFTDTVAALRRRRGRSAAPAAAAKTRHTRRQRRRRAREHGDEAPPRRDWRPYVSPAGDTGLSSLNCTF